MSEDAPSFDAPGKPPARPAPDPAIVAEWNAAMKRGRERSRKYLVRDFVEMGAGVLAFFAVFLSALVVVGKLFAVFVTREVDRVSFGDNARTLTVLVLGPLFLFIAPLAAAVSVVHLVRRRKR